MIEILDIITIEYDKNMWDLAQTKFEATPIFERSMRGSKANEVGCLGEVLVEHYLKQNAIPCKPVYSTKMDIEIESFSIDIKCKDRTVPVQLDYDATIPDYNSSHQIVDFYIFVSLKRDRNILHTDLRKFTCGYILGWCSRNYFKDNCYQAGYDPSNNWSPTINCKNIFISKLFPMKLIGLDLSKHV